MKCSSRRNCNRLSALKATASKRLNEVQLPKELQLGKSSLVRRIILGLNEVQLPKELQPAIGLEGNSFKTPQ